MIKRLSAVILCLCLLWIWMPAAYATEEKDAKDLSSRTMFLTSGFESVKFLTDKKINAYYTSNGPCSITLFNQTGIGSMYLMFDTEYGEYTVEDGATGERFTAGKDGFLHEYLDLAHEFKRAPTSLTIHFDSGKVRLSEIYLFSEGKVPDFVQTWDKPLDDKTDLLLLSTHGDDDQLFFAGLLPLYAAERDVAVQVAYLTDHRNTTNERTHEILNGLWAVGCNVYPVMGSFPDFRIDSLRGTYEEYARLGYSENQLLQFVTEQLRRFKPQVVVGHDIEGEYGHGMHMVYTDCLIKALDISNDPNTFPALAEQYGVWDVPKTYLHMYGENTIELDYDKPLSSFGGMTAFEVSQQLGYPCHKSQQFSWFTDWINGENGEITKATQIKRHNPCRFGLYRSTVGADQRRDDFLENIIPRAVQEQMEQERKEQEQLEQLLQEQARLEQERLELERKEQQRAEQERLEQERQEQERQEQLRLEQEKQAREQKRTTIISIVLICAVVISLMIGIVFLVKKIIPENTNL